jgi:hypothetical protein
MSGLSNALAIIFWIGAFCTLAGEIKSRSTRYMPVWAALITSAVGFALLAQRLCS